ncbi:guanylate kinase [Calycina marina]|uniref:Guanylate kinase n=1 Tax=Calycina marina TaxID=1763456 RepID=A0A9P7Z7F6_9HELO|nr:guanylate kinase [Calycina marina]
MSIAQTETSPTIISGPSGVGKGTLYKRLLTDHPGVFATTISHTTRAPRPGETRDVDYYFIEKSEFEGMIDSNAFVEHAQFGGNRYGTSKKTIEDLTASGKIVVLDIEMEGVKQIKMAGMNARYVFIAPPGGSLEVLESRLRGRGTETEESISKRLKQAEKELEFSKTVGVHDVVIYNDDLDTAYAELKDFIFKERGVQDQPVE